MFVGRKDDIYIIAYPRSGTTLMQMIVHQLMTDGDTTFDHISDVIPFLEHSLRRREFLEEIPSPRIFKTHLPYRYASTWPGRRIYVIRNGKDVLVSNFYMYKSRVNPKLSFSQFFDDFLAGRVQYGSWFQHVEEWALHADSNLLFVRYEDLTANRESCVERIAVFLHRQVSAEKRSSILEKCSISCMREHEGKFAPISDRQVRDSAVLKGTFVRRGIVGEWKELLTKQQELAFDQAAARHFVGICVESDCSYLPLGSGSNLPPSF